MTLLIKRHGELSKPIVFRGYTPHETLFFARDTWTYFRDTPDGLVALNGVTSILKIIDKSRFLTPWATKKCVEKVSSEMIEYLRRDGFYEVQKEDFERILQLGRHEHRSILESAGDIGSQAHDHVESVIKSILTKDEPRLLELLAKFPEDDRAANGVVAALEFMVAHDIRWIATEQKIFSRKWLYAGTMDGRCLCSSCGDPLCCPEPFVGRMYVIDWKTSGALHEDYLYQVGAYAEARKEEYPDEVIDGAFIIRLDKENGDFDPWHIQTSEELRGYFNTFRQALELSISVKATEEYISGVKENRKAAMKLKEQAEKLERMKIRCPKAETYKGSKMSKCLPDGLQCKACENIRAEYLKNKLQKGKKGVNLTMEANTDENTEQAELVGSEDAPQGSSEQE